MTPDLVAIVRLGEVEHVAAERRLSDACARDAEGLAAACVALLERGTEQARIRLLLLLKVVPYSVAAPPIEAALALGAERPVAAALDALESFVAGCRAPTPLIERAIESFGRS
ncbi:hypothetical protein L6R52_26915 [Myxococcota bacterium]|nr:hypothetical protein [Myxococcota bacterium]